MTHTWSLGCWQKLGQPGAQDLPAGLEGWQDATIQLGKGSTLPALGFLSPSGTDVPATAATGPPHSAKRGTRAGPHAVAQQDRGQEPRTHYVHTQSPLCQALIVDIAIPTLLMRKLRPQKLWVAEPGVLLGLTNSLHCSPLPLKDGENGMKEKEREAKYVLINIETQTHILVFNWG